MTSTDGPTIAQRAIRVIHISFTFTAIACAPREITPNLSGMTERLQIDGQAVRAIRQASKQTIAELAQAAGVAPSTVNHIELGDRSRQTRPVAEALARALGVGPAEIVINYPPEPGGRHRAAVERALAEAPPIDAEQARALRSLLAGYAARAAEDRIIAESGRRPA